jgi:predicted DNA-binding ribbon-helix-helix protein
MTEAAMFPTFVSFQKLRHRRQSRAIVVARKKRKWEDWMCHIFAGQDPDSYSYQTRSLRLNGQSTSIRLEETFWSLLEEIAASQDMTVPKFVSTLHDEVLEIHGEVRNFTSLLRCACTVYLDKVKAAKSPVAGVALDDNRAA